MYLVQRGTPLASNDNPGHNFQTYFFKILSDIIKLSKNNSPNWSLSFRFAANLLKRFQSIMHSAFPLVLILRNFSPNNVWWRLKSVKALKL